MRLWAVRLQTEVAGIVTKERYLVGGGQEITAEEFGLIVRDVQNFTSGEPEVEILSIVARRNAEGHDAGGMMTLVRGLEGKPAFGRRAAVHWTAGCDQVEAYDMDVGYGLEEHRPKAAEITRTRIFRLPTEEERRAALAHAGSDAQVIEARDPFINEDLLGISGVLSIRTASGHQITFGCGVFRGIPFAIPGAFAMPGAEPPVPEEIREPLRRYAAERGLRLVEARRDERGLAYLACSSEGLVILRLAHGEPAAELLKADIGGFTDDQVEWVEVQILEGGCMLVDAWHDGESATVVLRLPNGEVVRYGVDEEGIEMWARPSRGMSPYD